MGIGRGIPPQPTRVYRGALWSSPWTLWRFC